jgi:hypothetical protein
MPQKATKKSSALPKALAQRSGAKQILTETIYHLLLL